MVVVIASMMILGAILVPLSASCWCLLRCNMCSRLCPVPCGLLWSAEEIKGVPRRLTPGHVTPFGSKPIVLAACAGARHAGVIVCDETKGNAPRLYTAGKNWLAHAGTADTLLLPRPTMTPFFAPVAGKLEDTTVVEVACGHSHTLARTVDGRLFSWGRGDSGELGHGRLVDRSLPREARALDGHTWSSIVAGSYYSAGVAEPGAAGAAAGDAASKPLSAILEAWTNKFTAIARAEVRRRPRRRRRRRQMHHDMMLDGGCGSWSMLPSSSLRRLLLHRCAGGCRRWCKMRWRRRCAPQPPPLLLRRRMHRQQQQPQQWRRPRPPVTSRSRCQTGGE